MEAAAGVLVANQAQHILQFTQEIVRSIHLNHNLNRRDLIRTLLRQCRHEFPKYNVAIFEEQFAMIMSNDIIYNKSHELQDLISKFKFRLVIFGKGSISVLGDRHNGKRWGIDLNFFSFICIYVIWSYLDTFFISLIDFLIYD